MGTTVDGYQLIRKAKTYKTEDGYTEQAVPVRVIYRAMEENKALLATDGMGDRTESGLLTDE